MTGKQDLRYLHASEIRWFSILRIFQYRFIKGIGHGASAVPQNPGNHPGYGIGNDHGSQFSAGQYIIANGNQFIGKIFFHAVVHPFIVPADEHQMVIVPVKLLRLILRESLSGRRKKYDPVPWTFFRQHRFHRIKQRAALHKHASASAINSIIHMMMLIFGKRTRISNRHFHPSGFNRPFDNAVIKKSFYEIRKQGQNIKFHDLHPFQ